MEPTENTGSHQNPPDLSWQTLKVVRFSEKTIDGKFHWLFLPDQCRHCLDASGGTVESRAITARLSRIRKTTRACPDCKAQIPEDARVCQHCGYRDDDTARPVT